MVDELEPKLLVSFFSSASSRRTRKPAFFFDAEPLLLSEKIEPFLSESSGVALNLGLAAFAAEEEDGEASAFFFWSAASALVSSSFSSSVFA